MKALEAAKAGGRLRTAAGRRFDGPIWVWGAEKEGVQGLRNAVQALGSGAGSRSGQIFRHFAAGHAVLPYVYRMEPEGTARQSHAYQGGNPKG